MANHMAMHPTTLGEQICLIPNKRNFRLNTEADLPAKLKEKGVTKEVWKEALKELDALSKADPLHIKRWGFGLLLGWLAAVSVHLINATTGPSYDDPDYDSDASSSIVYTIVPLAIMVPPSLYSFRVQYKHRLLFIERVRDFNTKHFLKYGVSCHWLQGVSTRGNAHLPTPGLTIYECDPADDSNDDEAQTKRPGKSSSKREGKKKGEGDNEDGSSDSDDDDNAKVTPRYDARRHPNRVDE